MKATKNWAFTDGRENVSEAGVGTKSGNDLGNHSFTRIEEWFLASMSSKG
jgi:hypothetical protein